MYMKMFDSKMVSKKFYQLFLTLEENEQQQFTSAIKTAFYAKMESPYDLPTYKLTEKEVEAIYNCVLLLNK